MRESAEEAVSVADMVNVRDKCAACQGWHGMDDSPLHSVDLPQMHWHQLALWLHHIIHLKSSVSENQLTLAG
jgi:hypothetical protein